MSTEIKKEVKCPGCGESCDSCPCCDPQRDCGPQEHEEPAPGVLSDFFTGRRRFVVLPDDPDEEAAADDSGIWL